MADRSPAKSLRRRFVAAAVGVLAVGGTTMMATSPAHAQLSPRCGYTRSEPLLTEYGGPAIAVKQAQCELNYAYALGHSTNYGNGPYGGLTVDGSFGPNTLAAVQNFQIHCMGVTNPDGQIGQNTWGWLDRQVTLGRFC
jgi:lysozyme